jgi:hypothetical protein
MFLPEHGFIVESVGSVEPTKDQKHKYCEIILRKPAPRNEFGEQSVPDDVFQAKAWDKRIELLNGLKKGDKVKIQLSLTGKEQLDRDQTKLYYQLNLSVFKLERL